MNWATKQDLYPFLAQTSAKFPHHTLNNQKPLLCLWPGQCFTNYPEDKNHPGFLFKVFSLVPEDNSSPIPHCCSLLPVLGWLPLVFLFDAFSSWLTVTLSNTTPVFIIGDFNTHVDGPSSSTRASQFLDLVPFPLALFSIPQLVTTLALVITDNCNPHNCSFMHPFLFPPLPVILASSL